MKNKVLATVLLALTVLTFFAACGKKVECDFCGETKTGTTKSVFGETVSVCNDCMKELSEF